MIITLPKTALGFWFFSKTNILEPPPSLHTACSDFKLIVFAFSHCWHHTNPECMQGRDGGEGRNLLRKDIIRWKTKWLMHDLGKNKLMRKTNYRATEFSLHNRKIVPLFCFPSCEWMYRGRTGILWVISQTRKKPRGVWKHDRQF